ncbi:MAG: alkaline phosphatase family protein [Propionibacteriales bacterium]|nr:alkaline phosphatase family protein [Propionibacteriales bacterium]
MMDRRTFLRVSAAGGAGVVLSAAPGAPWASGRVAAAKGPRVYVLVLDGCRPEEIARPLMPRLSALRDGGMHWPNAWALPVMETIPNHVMMMTGVRPDRSGVPANAIYDPAEGVVRDLDRPDDLGFPTVLRRLRGLGLTTGSVLSKEYLYGIFGDQATYRWEPEPIVPASGHAPDAFTTDALLAMVEASDPDLVFVSLGDCDRAGHADITGTTLEAFRRAALVDTDAQVGRFVDFLHESGRWDSSVLIVLADHSMDWSLPWALVNLREVVDSDPLLASKVQIALNAGGADLLYWTGHAAQRNRAVARMHDLVRAVPGVLTTRAPRRQRLGNRAGDVVAYVRPGWRFSDPEVWSNPIPGSHGHPATAPIPFFVSGGSELVRPGVSRELARTVDVAPTVGRIFGLRKPSGGYDGRSRL